MRRPAILLLLTALITGSASAQPLRDSLYSANGPVHAAVEMNGILYIGGEFFEVGIPTGSGVPIDAVTALPQSMPKVVGTVFAIASDGAGGWFIGGSFTHVGGQPRQHLAHILADNSVAPWNPRVGSAANGTIQALLYANGMVYVGGTFIGLGGQPRNNIGAVDAVTGLAASWYPNTPGSVYCMARDGGLIYVGGSYSFIGGQGRANLSAFDEITGALQPWNPGTNSAVNAMTVSAGNIYVGGAFTSAGGQTRNRVAAFNGVSGNVTAWNPNANSTVDALVANGGVIYAGGFFTNIGVAGRVGIAALDTADAGAATSWNPGANGAVHALAVEGSTVYAGGVFTSMGGQTRFRLAAINAGTGVTTSWNPRTSAAVRVIGAKPGTAFVGGEFNSIGGLTRAHLAAIDLATGMLTSWNPNADNAVKAMVASGGVVYVGGHFTNVGSQTRVGIAALSAATGLATGWNPGASAAVYALALDGGTIYAGGEFGTLGGVGRNRIGALSVATGSATSWNPGATGGAVHTILVTGGVVYAGGTFTNLGGQPRNRLGSVDAATGIVTAWDPNPGHASTTVYTVRALASGNGVIYAGGEFNLMGGISRSGVAALDPVTGTPASWNPNAVSATVHSLCVIPGAVLVGGDFAGIGGQARSRLAAISSATGLALPWAPDPNGLIRAITVAPGGLYVGGYFNGIVGKSAGAIAGIRPVVTVNDTTVSEGSAANLTMLLLPPTTWTVAIDYATTEGSASTPADFDATGGTITFLPGEGAKPVPVSTNLDGFTEFNETFVVDLTVTSPTGVAVLHDGVITIQDDDAGAIVCRDFPSVTGTVFVLEESNGVLYVGGSFTEVVPAAGPPIPRANLAAIDLDTGTPTAWNPGTNATVRAIAAGNGTVYLGGDFTEVGGVPRNRIAAVDAATAAVGTWNPDASGPVNALAVGDGAIFAGGAFSTIGGQTQANFAALDATTGNAVVPWPGASDPVYTIAIAEGMLYVGGPFETVGGLARPGLAKIDAASGSVTPWNPQLVWGSGPGGILYGIAYSLAVDGNRVYVGGDFSEVGATDRFDIAAIDTGSGAALDWNPNGATDTGARVDEVVLAGGRVYAAGTFTEMGGQPRNGVASIDPNSGGADQFNPNTNLVIALAAAGGRIYAGGGFSTIAGVSQQSLACLIPAAETSVPEREGSQLSVRLGPNPARGSANLQFTMPVGGRMRISVYDAQGRRVARPVDGEFDAGPHRATWNTGAHGPGLYFVRFEALGRVISRRVIVLR